MYSTTESSPFPILPTQQIYTHISTKRYTKEIEREYNNNKINVLLAAEKKENIIKRKNPTKISE